jgi:hypothetical protein
VPSHWRSLRLALDPTLAVFLFITIFGHFSPGALSYIEASRLNGLVEESPFPLSLSILWFHCALFPVAQQHGHLDTSSDNYLCPAQNHCSQLIYRALITRLITHLGINTQKLSVLILLLNLPFIGINSP